MTPMPTAQRNNLNPEHPLTMATVLGGHNVFGHKKKKYIRYLKAAHLGNFVIVTELGDFQPNRGMRAVLKNML